MTKRPLTAWALALTLLAGCSSGAAPVATTPADLGAPTVSPAPALPAEVTVTGRAMVGETPLADAEVVLYDPIAAASPAAPGAGDGIRLTARPVSVRTDAEGRFSLPVSLLAGQAAELYVSNGAQSVCGVIVGPGAAIRNAGKVPIDAEHPLLLDIESTTTAGVMLSSLSALGRAMAKRRAQGPEAVLALQAKALDAMAGAVGQTAAELAELAGTADVAKTIAAHMVEADPRRPDPAAGKFAVLAAADDVNPVLDAVVRALEESGATSHDAIRRTLDRGAEQLHQATQTAFHEDADLAADLAAEIAAGSSSSTPDTPTTTHHGSGGGSSSNDDVNATGSVGVTSGDVIDPDDTAVTIGTAP